MDSLVCLFGVSKHAQVLNFHALRFIVVIFHFGSGGYFVDSYLCLFGESEHAHLLNFHALLF